MSDSKSVTCRCPTSGCEERLGRLREHLTGKVEREHELITNRMEWLITGEAFLFGALPGTSGDTFHLAELLCILGVLVGVLGYMGIVAAMKVMQLLGGQCLEDVERLLDFPMMGDGRLYPWTLGHGNLPARVLPPAFVGAWVAVALLRFGAKALPGLACPMSAVCAGLAAAFGLWLYGRIRLRKSDPKEEQVVAKMWRCRDCESRLRLLKATPRAPGDGAAEAASDDGK